MAHSKIVSFLEFRMNEGRVPRSEREVVYEDRDWLCVAPLSMLAARKYGADTNWCTATSEPRYWDWYGNNGSGKSALVYCINRHSKPAQREERARKIRKFQDLYNTDQWEDQEFDEYLDWSRFAVCGGFETGEFEIRIWDANNFESYDFGVYSMDEIPGVSDKMRSAVLDWVNARITNESFKLDSRFESENQSAVDWMAVERSCAEAEGLPDCVPSNVREWDVFIRQYERAVDLVEGRWEPHYDWETEDEFNKAVDEQFYLGKGYKKSIYECYVDLTDSRKELFHGVNWKAVNVARRFTMVNVSVTVPKLPKLPRRVVRDFWCNNNKLTSLAGAPTHVGGDFWCNNNKLTSLAGAPDRVNGNFWCHNNLLTSLEGAPEHVGKNFWCNNNRLTTLEGAPDHVGGDFWCHDNQLTSLEGAPKHVGGDFYCHDNRLTTLEGAPDHVGGDFWCHDNQLTSRATGELRRVVKGRIYESVESFTAAVRGKVPGFFDRASGHPGFVALEPEDVEYAPDGEPNRCERNVFSKCKSDPDRYLPVGGYIFERDFPIEHWWVYDAKLRRHLEVTPMNGPAGDVTGYCGIINGDLADEIGEARDVWDVDFFKGGNVYSKYFK